MMFKNKAFQGKTINIRDAIHGFINLNHIEQKIIKTYPFQRLRFIHQLGPTFFVYPTANHKRFEHSLGVAHLSSKIIKKLREFENFEITEQDEQIFRIACLIHDIGHAPFSHVGEDMKLFEDGIDHEVMTSKIISETQIGEFIKESLGEEALQRVLFISSEKASPVKDIDYIFNELLTGQAGIDRMDYLLRDSYYLGVMYGKYDLERLIETICFDKEDGIYWEEGGIHSLEQFILARYFMFLEVYFHKTRRSLDYHISQLIREFLRENLKADKFPSDVNNFLKIDDFKIFSWGLEQEDFRKIFIEREFFRKIQTESSEHPKPEEIIIWDWLSNEIAREFNDTEFYVDKAENAPYKFEKPDIKIKKDNKLLPIHEVSTLVSNLRPLQKIRIYVKLKKLETIENFVRDFLNKRGIK